MAIAAAGGLGDPRTPLGEFPFTIWHAPCEHGYRTRLEERDAAMNNRHFLISSSGAAAVASILAMIAFNIFAITQQLDMSASTAPAVAPLVELA